MQLRLMTPEDHRDVLELWSGTPGIGLNSIDDAPEGIRKYLERNPSSCFVALEDGVLAGAILCGHDGRRGIIHHLAVDSRFRRQGIGKRLLRLSVEQLKACNIKKSFLFVLKENDIGEAFYKSLYWREEDGVKIYAKII